MKIRNTYIFMALCLTLGLLAGNQRTKAQEIRFPDRWVPGRTAIAPLFSTDTLTLLVLGDVMMHTKQIEDASLDDGSYRFECFDMIKDEIASADIAIANMEFTLAGKPYAGYPRFSAPEGFALYAAECGFDIFLTANNHILDRGSEGAERTLELYRGLEKSHGVRFTGTAGNQEESAVVNPLILQHKGYRLALSNFTYGTNLGKTLQWPAVNYISDTAALRQISERSTGRKAELQIVFPHWGNEYELRHSKSQENTAERFISEGADLIIGAHPHVVQDLQVIDGIQVAYSLGNAVSNMSAANTQIGLMARIRLTRDQTGKAVILPVEFTYLWCSRPGGYCDTYMVLPVEKVIGTRDRWNGGWEYDKMIETYYRVMSETGIKDNTYNE